MTVRQQSITHLLVNGTSDSMRVGSGWVVKRARERERQGRGEREEVSKE